MAPVSSSFPTPDPPMLSVEVRAGTVAIEATDTDTTVIELDARRDDRASHDLIARTTVEQQGDTIVVRVPKHGTGLLGRSPQISVRAIVPRRTRLDVRTGSADVTGQGQFGGGRVESGSGDVRVDTFADAARMAAGSGDVTVGDTDGDLDIKTGSGDIHVGHVRAAASVQAGSGDVEVGSVTGGLRAGTGSGDVSVGVAESDVRVKTGSGTVRLDRIIRSRIEATAASGDIHVGVANGTAAWLDVHTVSGTLQSDLESVGEPAGDDEKVELRLTTVSGDITIARA